MRSSAELARERFTSARVARLATVSPTGQPHLVPVTFALVSRTGGGDTSELIVFAVDHKPKSTTALRRLDNIRANPHVAFLVDVYDDDWDRLWWARADAVASVADNAERAAAIDALRVKYQQYESTPPSGVVIASQVVRWSGWQARSNVGGDSVQIERQSP